MKWWDSEHARWEARPAVRIPRSLTSPRRMHTRRRSSPTTWLTTSSRCLMTSRICGRAVGNEPVCTTLPRGASGLGPEVEGYRLWKEWIRRKEGGAGGQRTRQRDVSPCR
jgi:hypothetical protein